MASLIHVGVISPVAGGFYFGEVVAGAVQEVEAAGGRVTLIQTPGDGISETARPTTPVGTDPAGWRILDGLIVFSWAITPDYLRGFRDTGKPMVLVSDDTDLSRASVLIDNETGVRTSVNHLADHGHTRIAFVGDVTTGDIPARYRAYLAQTHERGIEPLLIPTLFNGEPYGISVAPAVHEAWENGFTAVVAATDRLALGLMDALQARGLRVPEDLAIVGFDDSEGGWVHDPPLSTVAQRFDRLGSHAARLLLEEIRGEPVEHRRHLIPARFIPRRSCGCPPGACEYSEDDVTTGASTAAAVLKHVGLGPESDPPPGQVTMESVDLDGLEEITARALAPLGAFHVPPERRRGLIDTCVGDLELRKKALITTDPTAADVIHYCILRILDVSGRYQAANGYTRLARLNTAHCGQINMTIQLLEGTDHDPGALTWLSGVAVQTGVFALWETVLRSASATPAPAATVRAGIFALWEGPPMDRMLRVYGVFDPGGTLDHLRGQLCPFEEFPPRDLTELPGARNTEAAYVLPVQGPSGDYGMLCLVASVDMNLAGDDAPYDHWATQLGAALHEKDLLDKVSASEERYATAAKAANDGLWEWDVHSGRTYLSDRCRDLLDTPEDTEPSAWIDTALLEDRGPLGLALERAAAVADTPIEAEYRVQRRDGSTRWVLLRALGVASDDGLVRRMVGSLSDIDQRKVLEDQLRQAALYDTVTGLPNRRLFLERLTWAIDQARRDGRAQFAVAFLDLDGFKLVNDSLGHLAGDGLLRIVGDRLRDDLRSIDTAARFGGDEFAVLLYGLKRNFVLSAVERIQERITEPMMLDETEVSVTASIGIATSETGYASAEDVLRDADIAMYHAKQAERGTVCLFNPEMHTQATTRLRAHSEVRTALLHQQFVVHYQPVIDLAGSPLSGFEALVRWDHPERGVLLPQDFLAVMAETGNIVPLGQWIVDTVCAQIATWRHTYNTPVTVSINLSHREFWSEQLLFTVTQALSRHDVPPHCLILEITESVITSDPDAAYQIITDLHATGIRIHVDNFGTGHSSLTALRAFPLDALKIDRSFVHQLAVDEQTTELVKIIISMGRTLGLSVVAEGVETMAQADQLRAMGCGTAQGWLYAPALPGDEAGAMLGTPVPARAQGWAPSQD